MSFSDEDKALFFKYFDALEAGRGALLVTTGWAVTGKMRKIIREAVRRAAKSGRAAREEAWEVFQEEQAKSGKRF